MNNNITIIDKNGNTILAEGISYFKLNTTSKKYLFYTLNEKVENDLIKMYVSEVTENNSEVVQINDDEWNQLRQLMIMISKGDDLPDLEYLSMDNNAFNVGEFKKIAIKPPVIQSFKDAHTRALIGNQDVSNTPVVEESTPSGNFFNTEVVDAPNTPQADESNNLEAPNIFENPIIPENIPTDQNAIGQNSQSEVVSSSETPNSIPEIPTIPNVTIAPINNTNAVLDATTSSASVPETVSEGKDVVYQTPLTNVDANNQPVIPEAPVMPGESSLDVPVVPDAPVMPDTSVVSDAPAIPEMLRESEMIDQLNSNLSYTKEEALRAVDIVKDIVNKYFGEGKSANTDVIDELADTPVIYDNVESLDNSLQNIPNLDNQPVMSDIPVDDGNMDTFAPSAETPLIPEVGEGLSVPPEPTAYVSTNPATPVAQSFGVPEQENIPVTMPDAYQDVTNINPGSMAGMSPSTLDANVQE